MSDAIVTKKCRICGEVKPIDMFYGSKGSKDGRRGDCKKCGDAITKKYYHEHAEEINAYRKERMRNNPELKASKAASDKKYRESHIDKKRQYEKEYWRKNKAKISAYYKQWRKANREHILMYDRNYRSQNRATIKARINSWMAANKEMMWGTRRRKTTKDSDKELITQFYKWVQEVDVVHCFWCNDEVPVGKRQVDHLIPLSRGGTHEMGNICCACQRCNYRKHNKMPEEFMEIILSELEANSMPSENPSKSLDGRSKESKPTNSRV